MLEKIIELTNEYIQSMPKKERKKYGQFNSTLYDEYYRILNGSTQVNSTEINAMPIPDLQSIQEMGRKMIKSRDYSEANCNLILEGYCD